MVVADCPVPMPPLWERGGLGGPGAPEADHPALLSPPLKKGGRGGFAAAGARATAWLALWLWSTRAVAGPTFGAVGPANPVPWETAAKLGFDLSTLSEDGLYGPRDGRRVLDYEFCIPTGEGPWAEVAAIDLSAKAMPGSRGRIGCGPDQVLVLGNTHQPGFAAVLQALARLPFITGIQQAWFE